MTRTFLLFSLFAAVWIGCEGKTIQNLGAIDARSQARVDGIYIEILLLTETGERLAWDDSLTGGGILPIEDLDTRIEVWTYKDGHRHIAAYDGRLANMNWQAGSVNSYRALVGRVPLFAMKSDPEADGPSGDIEITLVTPKQGEFRATLFNVQIYPVAP